MLTLIEHLEQALARMDLERLHEAGALVEQVVMAHSIAEDKHLFDSLPTAAGGLQESMSAMQSEHRQLAHDFDQLRATTNEAAARGCLRRLFESVREHFGVEERVLFPVLARQIPRERLEELGSAWKRRRMREALP